MSIDSLADRRRQQMLGLLVLATVITIIITIKTGGGHDAQHSDAASEGRMSEPGDYPCRDCGAVFHTPFDLAFHMKWVHGFWAA